MGNWFCVREAELAGLNAAGGNFFHPAAVRLDDGRLLMTLQTVGGTDYYGEPQWAVCSGEDWREWSAPAPIDAFRMRPTPPFMENVADVRPFRMPDGTVIAFGCTTSYTASGRNSAWDRSCGEPPPSKAVYAVRSPAAGAWSARHVLPLPGVERGYRTACTQIAVPDAEHLLVPIYFDNGETCDFHGFPSPRFSVMTARYRREGEELVFEAGSAPLTLPVLRGFCEPSVVRLASGGYALTIRAEDGRMYVAASSDGIGWNAPRPWRWDDGGEIVTDTTQQHWVRLGDRVLLAYTRDDGANREIMRFRAPLYIAEAVPEKAELIRGSEQIVFPRRRRDGVEAMYGNFHCTPLDEKSALVTDAALFRMSARALSSVVCAAVVGVTE